MWEFKLHLSSVVNCDNESHSLSRVWLCDLMDCSPLGLLCPWNSPGQNIGVGSPSLFQEIFPTQESNSDLLHCRQTLYHLSHRSSPLRTINGDNNYTKLIGLLEKEMATHSIFLAWRIPWTEEPGGLQSMGLQRVGHNWATNIGLWAFPVAQLVKNPPAMRETLVSLSFFS